MNLDINELSKAIHAQNKAIGWWDEAHPCPYQKLQLVSTEIAEATEGEHMDAMDDLIPARKAGEVKLADALMRVLDFGRRYDWDVVVTEKAGRSALRKVGSIAGRHLFLNACLVDLAHSLPPSLNFPYLSTVTFYSRLVYAIIDVAEAEGYDIEGAVIEKLAYNKPWADHKRHNHAKAGGKKVLGGQHHEGEDNDRPCGFRRRGFAQH